eukprot:TRINITY_DN22745_c0_g1_i2.p1 TRINITY_DN22745_c0_g1~~TRINITY_DN22745_c0_g1_i2.p1  ORF type:complete len:622 (+),score=117.41 TRINITY_DN22745_c0_g1_i2:88-1953(+)
MLTNQAFLHPSTASTATLLPEQLRPNVKQSSTPWFFSPSTLGPFSEIRSSTSTAVAASLALTAGFLVLRSSGRSSRKKERNDSQTVLLAQRSPFEKMRHKPGIEWDGDMLTVGVSSPTVPEGSKISAAEARMSEMRKMQFNSLNGMLKQKHKKKARGKQLAPKIQLTTRPDNPWRDRYLLCQECEQLLDYHRKKPRAGCTHSTLLELDMTAPFSRNNTMVTSCSIVQLIQADKWVFKNEYGALHVAEEKSEPAFPVQVCAVCRKTSIDEGRRFQTCDICTGVHYCSDQCWAKHKFRHKTSCVIPMLPFRGEWGIRKQLRAMRREIYPMINKWMIKAPEKHRIGWLPPPEHVQRRLWEAQTPKKISLVGMGRQKKMLPCKEDQLFADVNRDGKIVLHEDKNMNISRIRTGEKPAFQPDEAQLRLLGMTLEEYEKKNAMIRAEEAQEDAQRYELWKAQQVEVEAPEPENPLALPVQLEAGKIVRARTGLRGDQDSTPVVNLPKLVLSNEALARVDAAAKAPFVRRAWPPEKAPWEMPRDPKERDMPKKKSKYFNGIPDEEKLDGVVYPESPTRELAKKHKLKLSEEALQRLEEAAEAGMHNDHRIRWQETPTDLATKEKWLLP